MVRIKSLSLHTLPRFCREQYKKRENSTVIEKTQQLHETLNKWLKLRNYKASQNAPIFSKLLNSDNYYLSENLGIIDINELLAAIFSAIIL